MLRYLRRLSDRDFALDRGMIPLGSCTMKLNATTEMEPVSLPGFADIHPFAPLASTPVPVAHRRARGMAGRSPATPRCRSSPTPAARASWPACWPSAAFHQSQGEHRTRRVPDPFERPRHQCGPAVMAGMRVVVVASLRRRHRGPRRPPRPSARSTASAWPPSWSPTPPPTGSSRRASPTSATIVHEHGGQVYIDGANLNALVGLAQPGHFGGDVSHLNLHKTFCIPHGGGGPGRRSGGGGPAPGALPADPPAAPAARPARRDRPGQRRPLGSCRASWPSAGPTSGCCRARAWPMRPSRPS